MGRWIWYTIITLTGLAFAYLVLICPRRIRQFPEEIRTDYAHRGLHGEGVPENSMEAFRRAVEAGYGIELDVQLSRDGEVMVIHDPFLGRMTGCDRMLSEMTAEELEKLSLQGTDQKIPRFSDVLALVAGRVPLMVELKGETKNTSLCPKVMKLLASYQGPYLVESFNPLMVSWFAGHERRIPRGLLYTNVCRELRRTSLFTVLPTLMILNIVARPQFISYDQKCRRYLTVWLTTHLFRAPRFSWTIHNEEEYRAACHAGEYAIFEGFLPPARTGAEGSEP